MFPSRLTLLVLTGVLTVSAAENPPYLPLKIPELKNLQAVSPPPGFAVPKDIHPEDLEKALRFAFKDAARNTTCAIPLTEIPVDRNVDRMPNPTAADPFDPMGRKPMAVCKK